MIDNEQFLQAIFGEQYVYAHVTSFPDDPSNIPNNRRGLCWSGGYCKDTFIEPDTNQFYTVSTFVAMEQERSYRRKSQFSAQYVLVLDDVEEKLPLEEVNKLPKPSFILRSSNYSYQWGYIFKTPCTERTKLDNLTDQLINNGLAPDGNDPGMKGVTRYVRLPEGVNTKAKRIAENGGTAPRCEITSWHPERKYTLEQLAEPFNVDLDAKRRDTRTDGAVDVPDHPIFEHLNVTGKARDGVYHITCPWIDDHTDRDDSGTALFTNADGTSGFQCHHGHCQTKNIGDVIKKIEQDHPGFKAKIDRWIVNKQFEGERTKVDFTVDNQMVVSNNTNVIDDKETKTIHQLIDDLVGIDPMKIEERNTHAEYILRVLQSENTITKLQYHARIKDTMKWNDKDFRKILREFQDKWFDSNSGLSEFSFILDNIVLLTEGAGGFYNLSRGVYQTPYALNALYSHYKCIEGEPGGISSLLVKDANKKIADGMGWHPVDTETFDMGSKTYVNVYTPPTHVPIECDVTEWLSLCSFIYGEHADLVLDHMAFTVQKPEVKIRWQILTWGLERTGKSMTVEPLLQIFGEAAESIGNDQFENMYDDVYAGKKVLIFEEVKQNDYRQFNRLKTKLANSNVEKLNIKGKGMTTQQNLYTMYLFSNDNDSLSFSENDGKLLIIESPSTFINGSAGDSDEFYKRLGTNVQTNREYIGGIYHHLLNRDVSEFQYNSLPVRTEAMYRLISNTRPEYEQLLAEMIEHKEGIFESGVFKMDSVTGMLRNGGFRFARKKVVELLKKSGFGQHKACKSVNGTQKQFRFWGADDLFTKLTPKQCYEHIQTLPAIVKLDLL